MLNVNQGNGDLTKQGAVATSWEEIMKRVNEVFALGIAAILSLAGCETQHRPVVVTPAGQVVVPDQPPPNRAETPGKPPGPEYTWVSGYYTYRNGQWIWVSGHWDAPPRIGATWIEGHWHRTTGGWIWTPGHWE
jgi:hypothetical protein